MVDFESYKENMVDNEQHRSLFTYRLSKNERGESERKPGHYAKLMKRVKTNYNEQFLFSLFCSKRFKACDKGGLSDFV